MLVVIFSGIGEVKLPAGDGAPAAHRCGAEPLETRVAAAQAFRFGIWFK